VPTTDFKVHDGLLAVQQTSEGRRLRLALEGEMDLSNTETAASALGEALNCGKNVVVDLGTLAFVDSTAIAMLVRALQEGGTRLSFLPSKHEAVRRLLSLTGLDERMTFASEVTVAPASEDPDAGSLLPAA
jgi:anti-anti-sigma factor